MVEREVIKTIRLTPVELQMIQEKMKQYGTQNFSAFVRKMAIDGYVVRLELPELKEMVSLLRYSSNNLKPEEYTMPIWRISARPTNGCGMRRGTFSLLFQSSNDPPYPCGM